MDVRDAAAEYQIEPLVDVTADDLLPGYKRTEVGVIPLDWEVSSLAALASVTAGGTPDRANARYWNGGIPWVTTAEIDFGVILKARQFISKEGLSNSAAKLLPPGTLLMALYGQGKTRGKVGVLGIEAATNQACAAISLGSEVNKRFVLHYLGSRYEEIRALSNTGNQENLNGSLVRSILIPLPTKAAQEAIAEALSDADALVESLQQLIAKQRAIKQGAMQALLTGRQRLPGFSGDWQTKRLDDLFTFSGGFTASRDQLGDSGHCYLHYGDIHTSHKSVVDTQADYADIPKLDVALSRVPREALLADGDVVFVDASEDEEGASKHIVVSNPDGRPFISGLHTIVAKARTVETAKAYRRYCFQTDAVKDQFRFFAVGTKVLGVSKGNIGKISLSVPPLGEQTAVAAVLSDMDAVIDTLEARLAKTRALKAGMMQQLLTGRIRLPLDRVA